MRRFVILAIAATGALGFAGPSMAQNTNYYGVPNYNTGTGTTYYTPSQNGGGAPVYNNGANVQPFPMQQMIAGRNAPSYNFNNGNQAYTGFGTNSNPMSGVTSIGSLTPQQDAYLRAQQQSQNSGSFGQFGNNTYQQQYYQQQPNGNAQNQGGAFSGFYNNGNSPFGTTPTAGVPTQKRVVYKERNNPLVDPPRLFNPDQ
ncbi:MAG: hypothetical protein DI626_11140 [Micavibrio aeruginosavorus]|uniref:Uncharacterized protein n=1 Tax=Micavibrio aeruginosavorus TaxID=349221 RepID=A0A2W4ZEZ3_9BACT|nr:MAG: hypothetical protein DI626_11140 [Micavibrio aeruginosavorus]